MISEWYHLPILQLAGIKHFQFSPEKLAKKLSIHKLEAELAIDRLERLELIEKDAHGNYQKTDSRLLTVSKMPQDALRKYHQQMLNKAIESLTAQSPQEKWIGSETFVFDSNRLQEANQLIEQFFDRMVQLSIPRENGDHVYHLSTCFFKVTENIKSEGIKNEKSK